MRRAPPPVSISDDLPLEIPTDTRRLRKLTAVAERGRGRIVMLVDNNVVPDSRVQKQARSAAARGWDVILLGHQRRGTKPSWRIGDARVRLITVPMPLDQRHPARRHAPLRSPLAYARPAVASYQRQLVRAAYADLDVRRARQKVEQGDAAPTARSRVRSGALVLARRRLAVLRRWTELRAGLTDRLEERRRGMESPLDRFTTAFWVRVMGDQAWRRLDPTLWDWELAYGPVVDKLKPDIIHANDFRMLGVGARAAVRARARGRDVALVWDAHEFLPGIRPWDPHPRWHLAQLAHEREHVPVADAVVTVSDVLADMLAAEHGLAELPTVVLNAPEVPPGGSPPDPEAPSLRERCGVDADVPLLVYSGSAAPQRGLDTAVEALPLLPGCHLALVVSKPNGDYLQHLRRRARELEVADRVHVLSYVPVHQIVPFLAGADVGLIPILHFPNHEISLITKFLEYSQARLPIVVSDVKAMAETAEATGQGEVFEAGSATDFARAVRAVLADPARYRAAYEAPGLLDAWTWESAADTLDGVYDRLRNGQLARAGRAEPTG